MLLIHVITSDTMYNITARHSTAQLITARDALKLVRRMWPHWSARGMRAEWALLGYHGRVLVSTRVQELKSPPCGGQAQIKAGSAAQGIGSLGAERRWRVLLHDGICPSAVSIALSGVPARKNSTAQHSTARRSTV